jgi:hypothetical protein
MNALMGNNKQSSGHGGSSGNPLGALAGQFLGGGKQSHGSNSGGGGSGGLAGQLVGSLLGGGKQSHGGSSGQQQQQQHGAAGGLGGLLGSVMGGGSSVSTSDMNKPENL